MEKIKQEIKKELQDLFPGTEIKSLTIEDIRKYSMLAGKTNDLSTKLGSPIYIDLVNLQANLFKLGIYMKENDLDKIDL